MAIRGNRKSLLIFIGSILIFVPIFLYSLQTPSTKKPAKTHHPPVPIQSSETDVKASVIHRERELIIFSKSRYRNQTHKPSENVICYLVASYTGDPRFAFNAYPRLRERVLQLDERFGDGNLTDVIIFHTGYPFRADLLPIIEGSRRHVEFVNIDPIFYKVSPGFRPHIRDPTWSQKGKWNYHQMCYFWFKQVFEMKIMQKYRYMMRLDDDSQLTGKWPNVFEMLKEKQAFYLANQREADFDYVLPGIVRIRNLTIDHIAKNNLTIQNPDMFADLFNKTIEIPNYWNNIEVIDLSFIRRKDVVDFTKAVDDSHGIFLYRWGDAPLRYVTLALFANASQVLHRVKLGLAYCHPC